jgi:hypothetical protein
VGDMTRLSRERIAEIRAWAAEWRTKGIGAHEAHALLAHLDAVTRERDGALAALTAIAGTTDCTDTEPDEIAKHVIGWAGAARMDGAA